jgi:hypothetical protein
MEEIFSSISGIESERIKEGSYNEVKEQIKNVAQRIELNVKQSGPFKWEENWQEIEYKEKLKDIKECKRLMISDSIGFKRIQVTNDIFGMDLTEGYLKWGKSFFEISKDERIWFPHLTPNKDWENSVSDDWNIINEKYIGDKNKGYEPNGNHNKHLKRYTFAKYKNSLGEISYRFIGVFKFKEMKDNVFIYEKINNELHL